MDTARRPTGHPANKGTGASSRVVPKAGNRAASSSLVRAPLMETEANSDGRYKQNALEAHAAKGKAPNQPRVSVQGSRHPAVDPSRVAALARRPRVSAVAMPGTAAAVSAAATTAPAAIRVDSTSFEEWMKMATDNKINSTNTWNFALIDYFHDMSLLRNDSGDGTINFQKASCTLDGCIKVWTSRVDSIVVETGRLLNGLQNELDGGGKTKRGGREDGGDGDADDDMEDGSGDEGDDAAGASSRKRKRNKAKDTTLAKDFSKIQVKKLDLEFTVDPLFKKTSADFDEGGAGGLLMNHLGVDHKARIVFDAGDIAGVAEDEDPALDMADISMEGGADASAEQATAAATAGPTSSSLVPIEMIDITKLRAKLLSAASNDESAEDTTLQGLLSRRTICPTLASFRFSKDDNTLFDQIAGDEDDSFDNGDLAPAADFGHDAMYDDDMPALDHGPDGEMDFFADADVQDGAGGYGDDDDMGGDDYDMEGPMPAGSQGNSMVPNRNGPDIFMALGNIRSAEDGEENGDAMFDYFDQKIMKNWAGPEHWKMRRAVPSAATAEGGKDGGAARTGRKTKESFVIDFLDEEPLSTRELFEPVGKGVSITQPKRNKGAKEELHLLPEDRHFSSKQLLRLFLKPRMQLNLRRRGGIVEMADSVPQAEEVDEDFWANAAASQDSGADTQGYDDSVTGGGFDPGYDDLPPMDDMPISFGNGEETDMDEAEMGSQMSKRIKPEYVNFAKKAKRVDIRKLKETIWKELAIPVADESDTESESGPPTPKNETRTFNDVLSGLRKTYPREKMEEISTSFCFICLLHLANEEGLKLNIAQGSAGSNAGDESFASSQGSRRSMSRAGDEDDLSEVNIFEKMAQAGMGMRHSADDDALGGGDEEEREKMGKVGRLQWLQIEKDPNAGRSA